MKKILLFLGLSFAMNEVAVAQSITLVPSANLYTENSLIKKDGIGFSQQSSDGTVKIGTALYPDGAFVQTHTNNALNFTTKNQYAQMTLLTNGYFGIGTTTPTANLHVSKFTRLGEDAPAIKMQKYLGTTGGSQGGSVLIQHGLNASKILSVSVVVSLGSAGNVFENYTQTAGYQVGVSFDNSYYIYVWNSPTNSANILNKPFKVLVTYEE